MPKWQDYLNGNHDRYLAELVELLRIPSISALREHADDIRLAAEWVAGRMNAAGAEHVQVMPTSGLPVVYGDWLHALGKPTVLVYGHFDVQPADPLGLWTTPPFEPDVRSGRLYARGASDMKANLLLSITAVEALLHTQRALPLNLKFLFEGQEEVGSPQLPAFVAAHRDLLLCDLTLNVDGSQWSETEPSLLIGLKGLCGLMIDVRGANSDLHSGQFGGTVQNPLHALAELLASLHDSQGRVAVEGFYDQVVPLSEADRQAIAAVPFDAEAYRASLGVPELHGEAGYSTHERAWARPTLEVNGMWGGFQGEGLKTVLPNEAHAKVSCRLVPDQDPQHVVSLVAAHVAKHAAPGVTVNAQELTAGAYPYLIPAAHPGNQAARDVLRELYGREPYLIRTGGSVPVCTILLRELGAYSVAFGFGLPDEQYHAPDEFLRLSSFRRGLLAYPMLLSRLGQLTPEQLRGDGMERS